GLLALAIGSGLVGRGATSTAAGAGGVAVSLRTTCTDPAADRPATTAGAAGRRLAEPCLLVRCERCRRGDGAFGVEAPRSFAPKQVAASPTTRHGRPACDGRDEAARWPAPLHAVAHTTMSHPTRFPRPSEARTRCCKHLMTHPVSPVWGSIAPGFA